MTTDTQATAPTLDELKAKVVEAEKRIVDAEAAAKAGMAEAQRTEDYESLAVLGGNVKSAKAAKAAAETAVKDFEKNRRWNETIDARRPVADVLSTIQKSGGSIPITGIFGDISVKDGNVTFENVRVTYGKADTGKVEEAIKAGFTPEAIATLQRIGVGEMSFEIPDIGVKENPKAVTIGPRGEKPAKTPKAGGTGGNGKVLTYNGMKAGDFLDWVVANRQDVVSQHAKSFENYKANGSAMNGLSNLAKTVASKVGAKVE